MELHNLKLSISRKSVSSLCRRQRGEVMKEVRKNLRLQHFKKCSTVTREPINNCDTQNNMPCPSASFTDNINDAVNEYRCDDLPSSSASSSDVSFCETVQIDSSFLQRLATCFIDNNLTHVQGNSILSLLRTHACFNELPKDVRTLLDTPRARVITFDVEPGEYVHFDLEERIIQNLSNVSISVKELELDFNIDGCSLDKSGGIQIWPIQCKIVNVQHTRPIIVGIYKGAHKPFDPNIFFQKFISDIKRIV